MNIINKLNNPFELLKKYLIKNNIIIIFPAETEELANKYLDILYKNKIYWYSGKTNKNYWNDYNKNTCYFLNYSRGKIIITYGKKHHKKSYSQYEFYTFEEILQNKFLK